jgi:hypothetical protein
MFERIKS